GRPLTITGADTPEHLRLHGRGMAADIRTHGLGSEQLDWLRQQSQQLGLSAKDYSGLTGPVTTSTGVRLTGPHFHVHYGGADDSADLPPAAQDPQSSAGQSLIKASAKDPQQDIASTPPIPPTAEGIATGTAPSAQRPSPPTRKPVLRRGNMASITVTP